MSKHYSTMKKKIFLEILKNFKHVEIKKSDSSTLRDKEVTWTEICKQYNNCTMILQEVNIKIVLYMYMYIYTVNIYFSIIYLEYRNRIVHTYILHTAYSSTTEETVGKYETDSTRRINQRKTSLIGYWSTCC